MTEALEVLEEMDFEPVATDLPGEWSTDGEWTVAIQTHPVHGGPMDELCHRVLVYEASVREIDIDTVLAAQKTDTSIKSAIRGALARAGYPLNDGSQ